MTTYYVSPTGNDSDPGTSANPWHTLQHACDTVQAGDTVYFEDGTYVGGVWTNVAGTTNAPITFTSINHLGARLVQSGTTGVDSSVFTLAGAHIRVNDFELTGPDVNDGMGIQGPDIIISRCWIHDICNSFDPGEGGGAGINIWNTDRVITGDGPTIKQCRIERIGPKDEGGNQLLNYFVHGIYAQVGNTGGADGLIENTLFLNNSGAGLAMYHNPQHWMVTNNTFVFCLIYGLDCWGDTNAGFFADHNTIQNNIIMQCGTVRAIWSPSDACGSHNIFRKNLAFGTYTTTYDYAPATINPSQTDTNLPDADPQFVNYQANGSGNYYLLAGSPAIDTATATSAPSVDFAGTTRPFGAGYDVGAFEWISPPLQDMGIQLPYAQLPYPGGPGSILPVPLYHVLYQSPLASYAVNGTVLSTQPHIANSPAHSLSPIPIGTMFTLLFANPDGGTQTLLTNSSTITMRFLLANGLPISGQVRVNSTLSGSNMFLVEVTTLAPLLLPSS